MSLYLGSQKVIPTVNVEKYGITLNDMLGNPDANGVIQLPNKNFSIKFPSNITGVSENAFQNKFQRSSGLTSVDFGNINNVGIRAFRYCFSFCQNLTDVDFSSFDSNSNLEYLCFEYAFTESGINSVYFPNLTTISLSRISSGYSFSYTFYKCLNLTSVSFPELVTGGSLNHTFDGCTSLTSIYFPKLEILGSDAVSSTYPGFYSTFKDCTNLTSVSLPELIKASIDYAFDGCTNLVTFTAPKLTKLMNSIASFRKCRKLTTIDLSNVNEFPSSQYMFYECNLLETVNINSLTTLRSAASMFAMETDSSSNVMTTFSFPSLSSIAYSKCLQYGFRYRTALTSLSFPALTSASFGSYTNQFNLMLQGVDGCTVHFPAAIQSVISSWTDVTAGFGGTNTTVLFDL